MYDGLGHIVSMTALINRTKVVSGLHISESLVFGLQEIFYWCFTLVLRLLHSSHALLGFP